MSSFASGMSVRRWRRGAGSAAVSAAASSATVACGEVTRRGGERRWEKGRGKGQIVRVCYAFRGAGPNFHCTIGTGLHGYSVFFFLIPTYRHAGALRDPAPTARSDDRASALMRRSDRPTRIASATDPRTRVPDYTTVQRARSEARRTHSESLCAGVLNGRIVFFFFVVGRHHKHQRRKWVKMRRGGIRTYPRSRR